MITPLKGINVLDFSTLLPGPFATRYLADMGAEILRVEAPNKPDLLRSLPPLVTIKGETVGASYAYLNRDKAQITLDLKSPADIATLYELVRNIDIVIEGFRPGVMGKLKLSYAELSAINPRIIYCSITGYGQTGPLKNRAGHDANYLALSGLASYSGTTKPVLSSVQIADIAAGSLHAVIGIQAALLERTVTGLGQFIDISMTDCCLALHGISGANALAQQKSPTFGSELLNGGFFYGYYETAEGRWLSVAGLEPKFVDAFCTAIQQPEWTMRFFDPLAQTALRADLSQLFKTLPMAHWVALFEQTDACVEPVLDILEVQDHPHFKARKMFQDGMVSHPIKYGQPTEE